MNANALINMVVRVVMQRLIGKGINAGIDAATRRRAAPPPADPEAARRQTAAGAETAKRARQTAGLLRRFGRF